MSKGGVSQAELEAALQEDILFLSLDQEVTDFITLEELNNNLNVNLTGCIENCLQINEESGSRENGTDFTNNKEDNIVENITVIPIDTSGTEEILEAEACEPNVHGSQNNLDNYESIDTSRKNNKYRRMRGLDYKGLKKDARGNFNMSEKRCSRKLEPTCSSKKCKNSKNKFCSEFDEMTRKSIFIHFWGKLNWDTRKLYVANLIDKVPTKRSTTGDQPASRSLTYVYHLKTLGNLRKQVCKKMFLNTLGLKNCMVDDWCKKCCHGIVEADKKYPIRGEKTKVRLKESILTLKTFLNELPKLPSHYCRASSTKHYLEPLYRTKSDLYREYKLFAVSKNVTAMSKFKFAEEFEGMNLALHRPKKDQCDTCVSHNLGNVTETDYQQHIVNKNEARRRKEQDKVKAKESNGTIAMFTADVEAVMLAPCLKASAIYYKTKLCVHNYTVYNMVTKDVDCYLWNESEGGLEANIFASLLIKHLTTYLSRNSNTKVIIIYTDSCGYQNKNVILANALYQFCRNNDVKIFHNYLEKGHTQMEVDSAHALIERKKKDREIYLPTDYISICREARLSQPFHVHYLEHTEFKNFDKIKYYTSIRPGLKKGDPTVAEIKSLKYSSDQIEYKLHHSDETYSNFRRKPSKEKNYGAPEPLYTESLKISEAKYKHLQELKEVVPTTLGSFTII